MPTYNYTCPSCGHQEDIFVMKVSLRGEQACGECGERTNQVVRTAPQPHWTSLAMGEGASPEAIKKFEKMRREQRSKEEKTKREHGDYGKAPGA